METTSQAQSPVPCRCQQQLGDALPWLAVALAVIVALDRLGRRKKQNEKLNTPAPGGANDGGNQ
jgi:hypothetical protein